MEQTPLEKAIEDQIIDPPDRMLVFLEDTDGFRQILLTHKQFKQMGDAVIYKDMGDCTCHDGKHPQAWNKGKIGEEAHNWKGGIHTRKDGYVRIRIQGKRHLLHRHVTGQVGKNSVVHHLDHNPSNNNPENLIVVKDQVEHMRIHAEERKSWS